MRVLQTLALPLGYGAMPQRLETGFLKPIYSASALQFLLLHYVWSGIRDSDSRLSPWQGDTLPLS